MTFYHQFDWVLVMPGGGHLEMNIVKAVVDLLWPVFYMDMVMLFTFRSESALHLAQKVSYHHNRDIKVLNHLFLVDISFEVIDSIFMLRSNRKDIIWAGSKVKPIAVKCTKRIKPVYITQLEKRKAQCWTIIIELN